MRLLLFLWNGLSLSQDIKATQFLLNSLDLDAGPEHAINGDKTKSGLIDLYSEQQKIYDGLLRENELVDLIAIINKRAQSIAKQKPS